VTIGSSIFMIVVGTILRYAITFRVHGLDLPTLGLILAIAGIVTLVLRLIWIFNPGLGDADRPAPGGAPAERGGWVAGSVSTPRRAAPRQPVITGPDTWPPAGSPG